MSNYFKKFPRVEIDPLGNRNTVQYTDFFRSIDVNDIMVDDYSNYLLYEIEDGDRPDIVSYKLYRTPDYYWTFFIVNDRLKDGMKEWPMSSIEFEEYLKLKYKDYGVCVIPPERDISETAEIDLNVGNENYNLMETIPNSFLGDLMSSSNGTETNSFTGRNSLLGLDYRHPFLRVRRLATNSDQSAAIVNYDERKFQLWLTDNNDKFFFSGIDDTIEGSGDIQFFLITPNDEAERLNQEWLQKTLNTWIKDNYPEKFEEIQQGAPLQTTIEETMTFNVSSFFREAKNAPRYYVDINNEPLCPLYCVLEEAGFPVTNFEQEEKDNEAKRFIRVIRPPLVTRFADEYRSILRNSPRLR